VPPHREDGPQADRQPSDVPEHGAGLDLMVDSDVSKRLAVVIKPGKDSVLKSPDSADLSSLDFVFCQFGQT
jgi:hypothetical protein